MRNRNIRCLFLLEILHHIKPSQIYGNFTNTNHWFVPWDFLPPTVWGRPFGSKTSWVFMLIVFFLQGIPWILVESWSSSLVPDTPRGFLGNHATITECVDSRYWIIARWTGAHFSGFRWWSGYQLDQVLEIIVWCDQVDEMLYPRTWTAGTWKKDSPLIQRKMLLCLVTIILRNHSYVNPQQKHFAIQDCWRIYPPETN